MSLTFGNETAYDALRFDQIDPFGEPYHVFVVRIGYTLAAAEGGTCLREDDEPALLVEEDLYFGEPNRSSVRCESDFAPYKPRCDVIVNATAYAPSDRPSRRFQVGLRVSRPDEPVALPEPPRGLNPLQPAPWEERQAWQVACELARNTRRPGAVLIDKSLIVTGERQFVRRLWPLRLAATLVRWGTLGLLRPPTWRLSKPRQTASVPLRYEAAWGGEFRINARDNRHCARDAKTATRWQDNPRPAKRLPKAARLTPDQLARHPEGAADAALQPVAHTACEANPVGRGAAPRWFLKATGLKRLPAPQIEYPHAPLTAGGFWRAARGKLDIAPAGLGSIGRAWQPRRALIGTLEDKTEWAEDEYPQLPADFDHRYWNAAPADQQCPHLAGHEIFELTNLCPAHTPGSTTDADGNRRLRFQLTGARPYLTLSDADGNRGVKLLDLDTVLIKPDAGRVELVWRSVVSARADLTEAELHEARRPAELTAHKDLLPPAQRAELEAEVAHGA